MSRETAEGLDVAPRREAAANEEFTGVVNSRDTPARQGWDPYEVWRTRVRTPVKGARARKDRPRDSRR